MMTSEAGQPWTPKAEPPPLSARGVPIWRFTTDLDPAQLEMVSRLLSDDERAAVDRFRFERDRPVR